MKFDNNTVLFLLLALMGITSIICIAALVFKYGATIELAILTQIPVAVVSALATAVQRKPIETTLDNITEGSVDDQ